MHALFKKGGFLLRKWSSSDPSVLECIPKDLRDSQSTIVGFRPIHQNTGNRMECLSRPFSRECDRSSTCPMHDQEISGFWRCEDIQCIGMVFSHHHQGENSPTNALARESGLGWHRVPDTILEECIGANLQRIISGTKILGGPSLLIIYRGEFSSCFLRMLSRSIIMILLESLTHKTAKTVYY